MTTISIRDFKARASEIIRALEATEEEVVITRHGKPCARLVPIGPERHGNRTLRSLRGALSHLPDADYEDFVALKGIWEPRSPSPKND